jgi:Fe-S-cluster containining protein
MECKECGACCKHVGRDEDFWVDIKEEELSRISIGLREYREKIRGG